MVILQYRTILIIKYESIYVLHSRTIQIGKQEMIGNKPERVDLPISLLQESVQREVFI